MIRSLLLMRSTLLFGGCHRNLLLSSISAKKSLQKWDQLSLASAMGLASVELVAAGVDGYSERGESRNYLQRFGHHQMYRTLIYSTCYDLNHLIPDGIKELCSFYPLPTSPLSF